MPKKYNEYDKLINDHVVSYGFITARQCADVFYTDHKYSIAEANRKLKKMFDKGWLKRCKDKRSNQFIYYSETVNEVPTLSHILLLDFYAAIVKNGATIEEFKTEVEWKSVLVNIKPMRSDGFMTYIYKDRKYVILIEVDVTHKYELINYERLYATKEIQNKFKQLYGVDNYFPRVVVITKKLNPPKHIGKVDVVYLNYELDDVITKVLI